MKNKTPYYGPLKGSDWSGRQPRIIMDYLIYKNRKSIGLFFQYNEKVKERVSKIKGIRYSNTNRAWIVDYSKTKYDEIVCYIKDLGYYPDFRNFWINLKRIEGKLMNQEDNELILNQDFSQYRDEIESFESYLTQRRYSSNTVKTYINGMRIFLSWLDKDLDAVDHEDVNRFNAEYIIRKGYSASYQNQVINAIKLFYEKRKHRRLDLDYLERPRRGFRLPKVIEKKEVERLLRSVKNIKHRTALTMIYALGLRSGELLKIKLEDIRSKDLVITIRSGKGDRDRSLPISENLVEKIRTYYRLYKPKKYLFEGECEGEPYSARSLSTVFSQTADVIWPGHHFTLHCLRHSFATHNMEAGVDLRYIQELLGHKSSKTTEIYTYVTIRNLRNIKTLTDDFDI